MFLFPARAAGQQGEVDNIKILEAERVDLPCNLQST